MIKKLHLFAALTVITSLLLAACGGSSEKTSAEDMAKTKVAAAFATLTEVAAAAAATPLSGSTPTGATFTSPTGYFSVVTPVGLQETLIPGTPEIHSFIGKQNDVTFGAAYYALSGLIDAESELANAEQMFFHVSSIPNSPVVGKDGFSHRELVFDDAERSYKALVYLRGFSDAPNSDSMITFMNVVFVSAPKGKLDEAQAKPFLESFKLIGMTAFPTAQPAPTGTPTTAAPCAATDLAEFTGDVTVPDGSAFKPDEKFSKRWGIKNIGKCTWGPGYMLVFQKGDQLDAPREIPLTGNSSVLPGAGFEIEVKFQAPSQEGSYRGYWAIRDNAGRMLTIQKTKENSMYVDIHVSITGIAPTATADLSAIPLKPQIKSFTYECTVETGTITFVLIDNSGNEDGFKMYRNGSVVADLPADSSSYVDNVELKTGKSFSYTLSSYNKTGEAKGNSFQVTLDCK